MQIDQNTPTPKYLQLKQILTEIFIKENWQPGQPLPTENELIKTYGVSRNTVRKTLDVLEKAQIIYKKQGSGSFYAGTDSNSRKKSLLIGVIVPRQSAYIYPLIIHGINSAANEKGYNIVLGSADVSAEGELSCLENLLSKNIDGLIFEPSTGNPDFENSPIFKKIKKLDIPVVVLDWMIQDRMIPFVSPNDIEGGYLATQYLLDAGHERIAFVYPNDTIPGLKRLEGYQNALKKAGIPANEKYEKYGSIVQWDEKGQFHPDNPHIASLINELLSLGADRPTAVIFYNDEKAIQGYNAIIKAGLKIPDDISVISFDDTEYAIMATPQLTSVIHPKQKLGQWAAKILLDTMSDRIQSETIQMVLNPSIATRDSVKAINK